MCGLKILSLKLSYFKSLNPGCDFFSKILGISSKEMIYKSVLEFF